MKKEDPYLSELDALDEIDEMESEKPASSVGDVTDVHIQAPLFDQAEEESELTQAAIPQSAPASDRSQKKASKEVLQLSPDVEVPVIAVMGRKSVTVQDLLELKGGQIVDFDRGLQDPVDLVAAGKVIAKGELVDVDGKLGIRVLKIFK